MVQRSGEAKGRQASLEKHVLEKAVLSTTLNWLFKILTTQKLQNFNKNFKYIFSYKELSFIYIHYFLDLLC